MTKKIFRNDLLIEWLRERFGDRLSRWIMQSSRIY